MALNLKCREKPIGIILSSHPSCIWSLNPLEQGQQHHPRGHRRAGGSSVRGRLYLSIPSATPSTVPTYKSPPPVGPMGATGQVSAGGHTWKGLVGGDLLPGRGGPSCPPTSAGRQFLPHSEGSRVVRTQLSIRGILREGTRKRLRKLATLRLPRVPRTWGSV